MEETEIKTVVKMKNRVFLPYLIELIEEGHKVTITVSGNSMRPFVEHGRDELVLGKVDTLNVGDVIMAEVSPGVFVCHRIIKMSLGMITMMGDGNVKGTECFPEGNVRAKVFCIRRKGKDYVLSTSAVWRAYSCIWQFLFPIRRYLLWSLRLTKTKTFF